MEKTAEKTKTIMVYQVVKGDKKKKEVDLTPQEAFEKVFFKKKIY